jgi:translation initiation factor 3 subunit E
VQERLRQCDVLLSNDYFLHNIKAVFMEKARMAIFEVYCRIHQCINLEALAKQIGMEREEAELWIAQLIRSAQLDARIDSSAGNMVMAAQYVDPLDAIVERTNNLSTRTFKVANAIIDGMQPSVAPV